MLQLIVFFAGPWIVAFTLPYFLEKMGWVKPRKRNEENKTQSADKEA